MESERNTSLLRRKGGRKENIQKGEGGRERSALRKEWREGEKCPGKEKREEKKCSEERKREESVYRGEDGKRMGEKCTYKDGGRERSVEKRDGER